MRAKTDKMCWKTEVGSEPTVSSVYLGKKRTNQKKNIKKNYLYKYWRASSGRGSHHFRRSASFYADISFKKQTNKQTKKYRV